MTFGRRRRIPWVQILILLTVVIIVLGGAAYILSGRASPQATPTSTPTSSPMPPPPSLTPLLPPSPSPSPTPIPPTPTPVPPPTATPTPRPTPEALESGVRVRVTIGEGLTLNLRQEPTLGEAGVVLAELPPGTEADVLEGPVEANGFRWWKLRTDDGLVGWAVEAFQGQTWLTPVGWAGEGPPLTVAEATPRPTPGMTTSPTPTPEGALEATTAPPTGTVTVTVTLTATATPAGTPTPTPGPLTVGGRARVTVADWAYLNVRAEPSAQAEIIGTLDSGAEVTILEGPVEADGYRWWKLDDGKGLVGWAVEGTKRERWLVPIE